MSLLLTGTGWLCLPEHDVISVHWTVLCLPFSRSHCSHYVIGQDDRVTGREEWRDLDKADFPEKVATPNLAH